MTKIKEGKAASHSTQNGHEKKQLGVNLEKEGMLFLGKGWRKREAYQREIFTQEKKEGGEHNRVWQL